jgi:flagellar hook-associated protein 3 FlgL
MRITDDSNYRNLLQDIQRIADRMQTAQNQVSSGKKLNRPSDNPAAAADVVNINAQRATNAQYAGNAATALSRLQVADSTLDGVQQVIDRIRSLALVASSNPTSSAASTEEIAGLRDQLLSDANTAYDGQYIFAGSNTDAPAYIKATGGAVSYAGNSGVMKLQVGTSTTLQTQIPGDQLFSGSIDVFKSVSDLVTAMSSGSTAAIQTQVSNLGQISNTISAVRSKVGGLMNAATAAQGALQQADLTQTTHLSQLQEADIAQALTEFSQSQTALQAATAVGARISSVSLLDYLQ